MATRYSEEMARFELRIPVELNNALQKLAHKGDRSRNAQIIRALRYYIENAKGEE